MARRAGLRGAGAIEGSCELAVDLGEMVSTSIVDELTIEVKRFEGKLDLEDRGTGKLREDGGAPRLGRTTPDLLNLTLSSSPGFTDVPARLSLDPTVSTFARSCY